MKMSVPQISCEQCSSRKKSVFCDLKKKFLEAIDLTKITNIYKKGQIIFHEGNPPLGIYCINKGVVKLTMVGKNGRESIIRLAVPGDMIGYRSLFSSENYLATATALEDSVICFLDKNFIQKTFYEDPSLAFHLIQHMSRDMGNAESRMTSFIQRSAPERIIEFLLFLEKSFGVKLPTGKIKINLKLTREEIASLVGATNETVIRCLSDLKGRGILEQDGKNLIILNKSELENFIATSA